MNVLDMKEIPNEGRLPFAWLDKRIADCLDCRKNIRSIRMADLYKCPRCGSAKVRVTKSTRIPYRTLTQARDEGRLLVYPNNPTATNAAALADWLSNPHSVKRYTDHQIKAKGAPRETHNQTRPAEHAAVSTQ